MTATGGGTVSGGSSILPDEAAPESRSGHRPPPPRAVLEGLRGRNPEAMGVFFEHYFDVVFGLVMRLLSNRAAAEDVTQEVFYKVIRAAHQLDVARDPGPWLTAIAYNACRDVWRSGSYRLSRSSGSIDEDPAIAARLTPGTNDPEVDALASERERLVQDAIGQLPEPLRTSIVLYDYHGLSHQQVADVMGIEHAAARKRYSRALAALAELLKGTLG